jgi:hypothetical protein
MGLRFRRSLKIAPGLRINLGLRGLTSLSVGGRGATLNLGKRGVKGTLSLPGTGLSYQHRFGRPPGSSSATQQVQSQPTVPPALTGVGRAIRPIAYLVIAAVLFGGYVASRHETPTEQANRSSVSSGSRATAAPTATTTAGAPNGSLAQRPTGPDAGPQRSGAAKQRIWSPPPVRQMFARRLQCLVPCSGYFQRGSRFRCWNRRMGGCVSASATVWKLDGCMVRC